MLPLKDRNPTTRRAYLTIGLIALNTVLFVLWQPTLATGPDKDAKDILFTYCHALVPWEVTHHMPLAEGGSGAVLALEPVFGADSSVALQLIAKECPHKSVLASIFTSMFMHGGIVHIAGNMLFLWVFGNNVEDRLGYVKYLLFYLACGVIAAFAHIASGPSSGVPTLGASGAIAGVLGAYMVIWPRARVVTLVFMIVITAIELPAWILLGLWFGLQFLQGVGGSGVTDVAVWAHIGGFVAGALIALAFFRNPRPGAYAPVLPPPPPAPFAA